ncbi:hypothetical protein M514_06887 [Trichuris suis]|uniref:Uncharacterized protein n=1 Tax=Trichuris suis TaxID=68888 RepID=A0A085NLP0_9BILA|nr:hypothetical protein M513_06887 [Trichuris suis]KFD70386.1 hypothetical protein M514_06887 [Trichuris suis]
MRILQCWLNEEVHLTKAIFRFRVGMSPLKAIEWPWGAHCHSCLHICWWNAKGTQCVAKKQIHNTSSSPSLRSRGTRLQRTFEAELIFEIYQQRQITHRVVVGQFEYPRRLISNSPSEHSFVLRIEFPSDYANKLLNHSTSP